MISLSVWSPSYNHDNYQISNFFPIKSPQDKTQHFFHRHPVAEAKHTKFIFVGPLLDKAGAKRAAGHKFTMEKGTHDEAAGNPAAECHWASAIGATPLMICSACILATALGDYHENL